MGGIGTATVISAIIGAASSEYQASQQRSAARKDKQERESAAANEQARLDQIAADTKPEEEGVSGEIKFGSGDGTGAMGSANDFLVPKSTQSALGGSGRAGLGFNV